MPVGMRGAGFGEATSSFGFSKHCQMIRIGVFLIVWTGSLFLALNSYVEGPTHEELSGTVDLAPNYRFYEAKILAEGDIINYHFSVRTQRSVDFLILDSGNAQAWDSGKSYQSSVSRRSNADEGQFRIPSSAEWYVIIYNPAQDELGTIEVAYTIEFEFKFEGLFPNFLLWGIFMASFPVVAVISLIYQFKKSSSTQSIMKHPRIRSFSAKRDYWASCPSCGSKFRQDDIQEWLTISSECPCCSQELLELKVE